MYICVLKIQTSLECPTKYHVMQIAKNLQQSAALTVQHQQQQQQQQQQKKPKSQQTKQETVASAPSPTLTLTTTPSKHVRRSSAAATAKQQQQQKLSVDTKTSIAHSANAATAATASSSSLTTTSASKPTSFKSYLQQQQLASSSSSNPLEGVHRSASGPVASDEIKIQRHHLADDALMSAEQQQQQLHLSLDSESSSWNHTTSCSSFSQNDDNNNGDEESESEDGLLSPDYSSLSYLSGGANNNTSRRTNMTSEEMMEEMKQLERFLPKTDGGYLSSVQSVQHGSEAAVAMVGGGASTPGNVSGRTSASLPTTANGGIAKLETFNLTEDDIKLILKDRKKKDSHNEGILISTTSKKLQQQLSRYFTLFVCSRVVERRRRFNINDRIKELGAILPKMSSEAKQNKGSILKASVDYIRTLQGEVHKAKELADNFKKMAQLNRDLLNKIKVNTQIYIYPNRSSLYLYSIVAPNPS